MLAKSAPPKAGGVKSPPVAVALPRGREGRFGNCRLRRPARDALGAVRLVSDAPRAPERLIWATAAAFRAPPTLIADQRSLESRTITSSE